MIERPNDLPDFKKPPVAETVLSLQFEPIAGLTSAHLGLLWTKFRRDMPLIEEHPPLPPVYENFDAHPAPRVEVSIEDKSPTPRLWFLNQQKNELIQVQPDRLIRNWRRTEELDAYPRYEPIRTKFREEVARVEEFLRDEGLGAVSVRQCEVTYVNHIAPAGVWTSHADMKMVFAVWSGLAGPSFLPTMEDAGIRMRFVIPSSDREAIGRLHVTVQPVWRKADDSPIFAMNLTARGTPLGDRIENAFEFFDLARKWIVRGFADLTTPQMHRAWERIDV
ncbi:MAG: TIGR04255 family protein [Acidobacteria bacterium]|nr:TIGR04255 family protein [Acidobacteriota bacterium]